MQKGKKKKTKLTNSFICEFFSKDQDGSTFSIQEYSFGNSSAMVTKGLCTEPRGEFFFLIRVKPIYLKRILNWEGIFIFFSPELMPSFYNQHLEGTACKPIHLQCQKAAANYKEQLCGRHYVKHSLVFSNFTVTTWKERETVKSHKDGIQIQKSALKHYIFCLPITYVSKTPNHWTLQDCETCFV